MSVKIIDIQDFRDEDGFGRINVEFEWIGGVVNSCVFVVQRDMARVFNYRTGVSEATPKIAVNFAGARMPKSLYAPRGDGVFLVRDPVTGLVQRGPGSEAWRQDNHTRGRYYKPRLVTEYQRLHIEELVKLTFEGLSLPDGAAYDLKIRYQKAESAYTAARHDYLAAERIFTQLMDEVAQKGLQVT